MERKDALCYNNDSRILVIKGKSSYEVLRTAADEMITYWKQKGIQVEVIDLNIIEQIMDQAKCSQIVIDAITCEQNALIFSFQALLFDAVLPNGESVMTLAKCPVVGHIVDFPIYHKKSLEHAGDNMQIWCIDQYHEQFIRKYYPKVKQVRFAAHKGFKNNQKMIPWEERSIEVLFSGRFVPYEKWAKELESLEDPLPGIGNLLINRMLEQVTTPFEICLEQILIELNIIVEGVDYLEILEALIPTYRLIYEFYRFMSVQVLLNSGIQVSVCGDGWENYPTQHPEKLNILEKNAVPIEKVLEYMGNSKVVLNAVPIFKAGGHERIFSGMLAGAVCVTDTNRFLEETISEEAVFYQIEEIEKLPVIVENVLNHPEKAVKIAQKGYERALKDFTWEQEAEELLTYAIIK